MRHVFTVALLQQSCNGSREENLADAASSIREAAAQGAELILLPELHLGPYFCQTERCDYFDLAEPIPGPTSQAFAGLAKELGVVIVGHLFEKRAPGVFHNTAIVLDKDGSLAGTYRKMHIPDDPGFYEKFYFTPGDLGFTPIDTQVGKLGVLVCWDQWFPEAARLMALAGAEILLYPTAIGWDPRDEESEKNRQLDAWITIQRSHAIANGIPLATCNRIGFEADPSGVKDGIFFWGNSFIAGPQGEILSQAASSEKKILLARIDRLKTENVRRIWPYFRDRRIDAYGGLLRRLID